MSKENTGVQDEILLLKEREQNYEAIKEKLIANAKTAYGDSILTDYSIPNNFDISLLDENEILARTDQTTSVPYSNETFKEFLTMHKKVVKNIFIKPNKRKTVQGMFLVGKNSDSKYTLFSLTVVRDDKVKSDYSIVLNVKPQGKFWMNVARIDCSIGMSHPNYIENGNVVSDAESLKRIPTPHIHISQEQTQVLFYDNLTYSLAKPLEHLLNTNREINDKENLMTFVKYMLDFANIDIRTMENVNTNLYGNYLFNFEDVHCVNTPKELEM